MHNLNCPQYAESRQQICVIHGKKASKTDSFFEWLSTDVDDGDV